MSVSVWVGFYDKAEPGEVTENYTYATQDEADAFIDGIEEAIGSANFEATPFPTRYCQPCDSFLKLDAFNEEGFHIENCFTCEAPRPCEASCAECEEDA